MTTLENKFMTRIISVSGVAFTVKMGVLNDETKTHDNFDQTIQNIHHFLIHVAKLTAPAAQTENPLVAQLTLDKTEFKPLSTQINFVTNAAQKPLQQTTIIRTMIRQWAMRQAYVKYLEPQLATGTAFAVAIDCAGNVQVGTTTSTSFTWELGVLAPDSAQTLVAVYHVRDGALATQHVAQTSRNATQATILAPDLSEAGAWAAIAVTNQQAEFLRIAVMQRLSGLLISSAAKSQSLERGIVQEHQLIAV